MKKVSKPSLKSRVESNTRAVVKNGMLRTETTIKDGSPLDHSIVHSPTDSVKFGISKGITKNMDNYESLRVDVWLTDSVLEGETLDDAFSRVNEVLDEQLEKIVSSIVGE